MPGVQLGPEPKATFLDADGNPLAGGFIYTYAAGTNTPQATYTDFSGLVANTNPIVLDAAGRAAIWFTAQAYKIVVEDANHVQQYETDNFSVGIFGNGDFIFSGDVTVNGTLTANGPFIANSGGALNGTFSGNPNFSGSPTFSGTIVANRFQATVATGTSPFIVASTTVSANLHAEIADKLATTTNPVNVVSAPAPTAGQVLQATSATTATWQTPTTTAEALGTSGADVNVGAAAPPTTGQVLTATDATHATWQSPLLPTITLKQGTNAGNYTSASTSFVDVDGTNLSYTVVIPTGWKLAISASGIVIDAAGPENTFVSIADGGSGVVAVQIEVSSGGTPARGAFSLNWVIDGDGASHVVTLQYATTGGHTATIQNGSNIIPTMVFILSPSN